MKQKTENKDLQQKNKITDLRSNVSIIILNECGINTPIKPRD